jgi:hypothetical protein
MKEGKINRPTRYLAAWGSVSTGIDESVLDWKLREQRMSEMNERLNDGGQRFRNWVGSSVGLRSRNWFTRTFLFGPGDAFGVFRLPE